MCSKVKDALALYTVRAGKLVSEREREIIMIQSNDSLNVNQNYVFIAQTF